MPGIVRTSALNIALAATLAVAATTGIGGAATAAPAATSGAALVHFDFVDLVLATPQQQVKPFSLPTDAVVTTAQILTPETAESGFEWRAEICDADNTACRPLDETLVGARLDAGTHQMRVGVTMTEWAESSAAIARIDFTEAPQQGLATTGVDSLWWFLAAASAASAVGLFLVIAARRRREHRDDQTDTLVADQRSEGTR